MASKLFVRFSLIPLLLLHRNRGRSEGARENDQSHGKGRDGDERSALNGL